MKKYIPTSGIYNKFLKGLANETRFKILRLLLDKGPLNVMGICKLTRYEQSRVSHALRLLKLNKFVRSERKGKMMYYDAHKYIRRIVIKTDHLMMMFELYSERWG